MLKKKMKLCRNLWTLCSHVYAYYKEKLKFLRLIKHRAMKRYVKWDIVKPRHYSVLIVTLGENPTAWDTGLVWKREISCPCRELNADSLVFHTVVCTDRDVSAHSVTWYVGKLYECIHRRRLEEECIPEEEVIMFYLGY